MRKLVESTFMTLDGVISNPQEWSPPFWDDEHSAYAEKLLAPADAMLLGRATYENFAASWPGRPGEFADKVNSMPKHVASRTLSETTWNASLIEGDAAAGIAALKEQVLASVRDHGLRMLGPNSLGLLQCRGGHRLNATLSRAHVPDGRVAISFPASATPMMMLVPQPRWQHSSAVRMTSVLPVASNV